MVDLAGKRILVIDDSATVCKFIGSGLREKGFQTIIARAMEDALASVDAMRPDMVVTDIFMPGVDGIAGIPMLRKKLPDVGVIAISAGNAAVESDDVLIAARRVGADAVMKKPFTIDDLAENIGKVMSGYSEAGRKPRLLVFDDSRTVRKFLTDGLSQCGYSCAASESMEEAFASSAIVGLDLVITDIFMPGEGGIAGIQRIRKDWPDVKIIAISGGTDGMQGETALEAAKRIGANAVLKKPFGMAELAATVERVMN